MQAAYRKSGLKVASAYRGFKKYSTMPYQSEPHGWRYVHNYGNDKAKKYIKYEDTGPLPQGSVLAKDSFLLSPNGRVGVGPLFLMEKMAPGTSKERLDWQYTMVMPNGAVQNTKAIQKFCNDCHSAAGPENDHLMFLPEEYQVKK